MQLLLVLAAVAACTHGGPPALKPGDLRIRDVTIVSPERPAPLPHADVVVRDGRIAWIGPATAAGAPDPAGVTTIAGAGRFLTPGLIDAHVHLAEVPGLRPEDEATMGEVVEAYFRQLPRSWLYFGFTAVVDLNVVDRARLQALRSAPLGPAILDCGGGLALANGYPMSFAPPAVRFRLFANFLWDDRQAKDIPADFAAAEHTPAATVARVAADGGSCVKAFWESGFGPQRGKLPVPTPEMMREVLAGGSATPAAVAAARELAAGAPLRGGDPGRRRRPRPVELGRREAHRHGPAGRGPRGDRRGAQGRRRADADLARARRAGGSVRAGVPR